MRRWAHHIPRFLLIAWSVVALAPAFAQRESTALVDSLNSKAWALRDTDPVACTRLGREAARLSRAAKDTSNWALALRRVGLGLAEQNKLDSALAAYREALALDMATGNAKGMLSSAQKIGDVLKDQDRLEEALAQYAFALHVARTSGDQEALARSYSLMAPVFQRMGNYEAAVDSLHKAIEIRKAIGDMQGLMKSRLNMGGLLLEIGRFEAAEHAYKECLLAARQRGDMDNEAKALVNLAALGTRRGASTTDVLAYADSALALLVAINDSVGLAGTMLNKAAALRRAGRPNQAMAALGTAMAFYRKGGNMGALSECLVEAANIEVDMGRPAEAAGHAREAVAMATASGNARNELAALNALSGALKASGDLAEAHDVLLRYMALSDSVLNERTTHHFAMAEMREKYEARLRLEEIDRLRTEGQLSEMRVKRRNNMVAGLILVAGFLAALAFLAVRNVRHQKRLRAQEQTLHTREVSDLLKQQEINSLESMMKGQERERERVGRDLHDRIGSMLSSVKLQFSALEGRIVKLEDTQRTQYEKVTGLLDEAVAEVRRISHDMVRGTLAEFGLLRALQDLGEALYVPGKLNVELSAFGMEARLPQPFEIGVYRMVQECVSNVLRHARATELTIQVTRSGGALNVLVEDNGRGFNATAQDGGLGLRNIKERAAALGGIVNVDSAIGRGTTVSIDLPLS